jgi:hypothetical protein
VLTAVGFRETTLQLQLQAIYPLGKALNLGFDHRLAMGGVHPPPASRVIRLPGTGDVLLQLPLGYLGLALLHFEHTDLKLEDPGACAGDVLGQLILAPLHPEDPPPIATVRRLTDSLRKVELLV